MTSEFKANSHEIQWDCSLSFFECQNHNRITAIKPLKEFFKKNPKTKQFHFLLITETNLLVHVWHSAWNNTNISPDTVPAR